MGDGSEAIWQQLSRLFVLSTFNRRLNSTLSTHEAIRLGSRMAGDLLDLSGFALYVVRSGGDELELAYADEAVAACYDGAGQMAAGEGVTGQVLATGASCSVDGRLLAGAPRGEVAERVDIPQGERLCVPVVSDRGEVLGVAHCHRAAGSVFSPYEHELIQEIAADLGRALDRAWAFDKLRRGVIHDELTGLHNRIYLKEQIEHELQQQKRYGTVFSLAFLDIDHFKAVNDTYGHAVGDRVLCAIAERIRGALRGADSIYRYGGEEFVLLLPHTSGKEAAIAVNKVRAVIAEAGFAAGTEDGPLRVSVTGGVASAPADADSAERLLEIADRRLYAGKLNGRNQIIGREAASTLADSGRRQAARCTVALSATSATRRVVGLDVGCRRAEEPWLSCLVEDISHAGLRVNAPINPAPGEDFPVRALLEDEIQGERVAITVTGRVVHTQLAIDGGTSIGLAFEGEARSQWRQVFEAFYAA